MEMTEETISFAIDGEVTLEILAGTTDALHQLLRQLSGEAAPGAKIKWLLRHLEGGSLHTAFAASSHTEADRERARRVTEQYLDLGRAYERGEQPLSSDAVLEAAETLLSRAQASGTAARFGAGGQMAIVDLRRWAPSAARGWTKSIGSVTGTLEAINLHGQPYVTVYEQCSGQRVRCYLSPAQRDLAASSLGKRVLVRGTLTQEAQTRRKREIRKIIKIDVLAEAGEYRMENAFGAGRWQDGYPTSDMIIRELRDWE